MIKETRLIMGMPVTVQVCDVATDKETLKSVFDYFTYIDETFSTYKETSEITKINKGDLKKADWSEDMKTIILLCDETRQTTDGYFDIRNNQGKFDPSGIVKGWAIFNTAKILEKAGYKNFYVEAGGDIQTHGTNNEDKPWSVGIKNPFKPNEIVKVVLLKNNEGIATSGAYERGAHIYNPKNRQQELTDIVSVTVIGPNIYEADRFATAAFAMQKNGINFIEKKSGLEGYFINKNGIATQTTGFSNYASIDR